jgi:hypothetical protein
VLNVRERALLHSITTRVGGRSCTGPRYNMRVGKRRPTPSTRTAGQQSSTAAASPASRIRSITETVGLFFRWRQEGRGSRA